MKRAIFRVVKRGTKWIVKSNREELSAAKLKSSAIDRAFWYAKKASPSFVRIYSAAGKLQVESEW